MKILIVGGGPAGLSLAYWLVKDGHTPIIVEKASTIRTAGYMIDLTGTGYDLTKRMGIINPLKQVAYPVKQVLYKNARGNTVARMPMEKLFSALDLENNYLALDHRDLVEAIFHTVENDVEVRFNTTVNAIVQSADDVTVTFSDGTQESFDLLVGADGIHSKTRSLIFGDESQFDKYLGYYVATFYAPAIDPDLEYGYVTYLEPGIQLGIFPQSGDQWLCYVIYKSEDRGRVPSDQHRAILREQLNRMGWVAPKIIDALPPDTPILIDTVTQIEMPTWSQNRVALIGDAAYCLTLISGQGASMALAGGYFLAKALRECPDYQTAFQQYEHRLRDYIAETQAKARRFAPNFVPGSRLGIMITQWVIHLIGLPFVKQWVGKQLNVASIIGNDE